MKKILFFTAVAALSAMVSCQKEEAPSQKEAKPIVFSASIAAPSDTKVSVNTDDGKVSWVKDDEITITDGTYTGVYKADNAGETTTFTYVSGYEFKTVETATEYEATYGTQPAVGVDQTYSDTPGKLIYMIAEADVQSGSSVTAVNFTFTAQCGLLKLNLTATDDTKVKRIYVIDESGNAYKLLCETARTIEGGKDFYIALPAGKYTKYIIRNSEGYEAVKTAKTGKETSIAVNQINKVTFISLTFAAPVYPESSTAGTKVAGYWWAPVNCGYEPATTSPAYKGYPYGKLYQWGRKYGQGYTTDYDATAPTLSNPWAGTNGNEDSNAFYKSGSGTTYSEDWIQSGSNYYWNSATGDNGPDKTTTVVPIKTTHDPCPTGWRVPTYAELYALLGGNSTPLLKTVGSQKGAYFNGTSNPGETGVFFPAAGYRMSNGSVYYRDYFYGYGGNYWSSSVSSYYGYYLNIYLSDGYRSAEMKSSGPRACGFSVRCVQE